MHDEEELSDVEKLRKALFATIESVQENPSKENIEAAKVISDLSQVVINSAKVEVDALKVMGGKGAGSGFFPNLREKPHVFNSEYKDLTRIPGETGK